MLGASSWKVEGPERPARGSFGLEEPSGQKPSVEVSDRCTHKRQRLTVLTLCLSPGRLSFSRVPSVTPGFRMRTGWLVARVPGPGSGWQFGKQILITFHLHQAGSVHTAPKGPAWHCPPHAGL